MNRGGFSWSRLLGISAMKGRISRQIGIPLTRRGRNQKVGRIVTSGCGVLLAALTAVALLLVVLVTR